MGGAPGGNDPLGAGGADARHPQQRFIVGPHDLHGELLQMGHRPAALGVKLRIDVRVGLVQQLAGLKAVEPQQPVRLIEPVLPQQRRLGVQRGEKAVLHHRHIGGIKHPL